MEVTEERRTRYRVPVTAAMMPAAVLLIFGVFLHLLIGAAMVAVIFGVVSARRHGLELTEHDAVVRSSKPARIPWSSVTAVRGGGWRGGLVLQTATWEEMWSPAPCSWWAGPASADQVAEVERWWIDHRGPAWTPAPAVAPFPVTTRPPLRYRTSMLARSVAVLGVVVAALNASALWWPLGGFTVLGVEFTEPSIVDPGWLTIAAVAAGAVLGAWWAVRAHRLLTLGSPPDAAVDARPGSAARTLLVVAAAGMVTALGQWLGAAPGIGSLTMVSLGVAAAIAGASLAAGTRRFEERTGRLLLSGNPFARGMGLEVGPRR